jgi:intracellular multiplication protein IcmB
MKALIKWFTGLFSVMGSTAGVIAKQSLGSYCDLQTADSDISLVCNDGSLVSVLKLDGISYLVGKAEFDHALQVLQQSLQSAMRQSGRVIQVQFNYDGDAIKGEIKNTLRASAGTSSRLNLDLKDLFQERERYLSRFCATESVNIVIWTRLKSLTKDQLKQSKKKKAKEFKNNPELNFLRGQNILAAIPELRNQHESFIRLLESDMENIGFSVRTMPVHDAVHEIRACLDPDFTDRGWEPVLPGDKITVKESKQEVQSIGDIMWPSLSRQLMPRDALNLDIKTVKIGDKIYSSVFIDLFPKDIQPFHRLLSRTINTHIPWRISFHLESDGTTGIGTRKALSSILAITSSQNRLLNDSLQLLDYINMNTDDAVVKLRVSATTWAQESEPDALRNRASILAKAIEGWGSCDVTEICGDALEGALSTIPALTGKSVATASLAPLSDVLYMMPLFRPASSWDSGAILFRSPDGKLWPYQPGSSRQTTWIDLFYARPGSGKSVLSNAINLAVCLSPGIQRLPRISIIDIGPSSTGLISLLQDALPLEKKRQVCCHRLRMLPEYSINPFDTQLGCRVPVPQERAFLVNFISLLATPVGSTRAYEGVADMAGLIVDEVYKHFSDGQNPNTYTRGIQESVDVLMDEINFVADAHTTWWEIVDALFTAGFHYEAGVAQRYAVPVMADLAAICRTPAIEDLYGKITAPTGESLIQAFQRMLSAAAREYPIISQVTQFDLGDARIVALDLDEVARSGGDAADRQTAVMYMLARYVMARHYYLNEDNVMDMPTGYRRYHKQRIAEIREDPKRIVYDEFHRTSKAQAVRDQVIVDMREGRKWKVQIALLSQSLDDFDSVMIEFATSVFIMDAGPEQTVRKTQDMFGFSETAANALRTRVNGPGPTGATFLAQFSTKDGPNTQLLTATLGPVELWALSTTAEDVMIRKALYERLGPRNARQLLAGAFPSGSAVKMLEERYAKYERGDSLLDDDSRDGVIQELIDELVQRYHKKEF